MVVFTCNNCGDSVKKPAVEKHYNTKCRGQNINVSCMDCQKDFLGNEHVAHIKCITEAEKYSAKGFVQKESKNKNAKKQDSWISVVRSILDSSEYKMHPRTREAFQRLQNHENVPRKQAKFENFATKCLRMPKNVVSDVWSVLEKELNKMTEARKQELEAANLAKQKSKTETAVVNGNAIAADTDEKSKKKKKRKTEENEKEETEEPKQKKKKSDKKLEAESVAGNEVAETVSEEKEEEFAWQANLEKCINKTGEHGIDLDKLKNKILKKYKTKLGVSEFTEKQSKKFEKKFTKHLKKCINVKIENNVAKIL